MNPKSPISPVLTDNASVQDMGPGGVLNQLPSLKASADSERKKLTVMNDYSMDNMYSSTNPDSLSDIGRGENNNAVGTKIDQLTKNALVYSSGNKFKPGMGYYNNNFPEQYW